MIEKIANDIASNFASLHWADNYAGLVITATKEFSVNGQPVRKSFPISCDLDQGECFAGGQYKDLVPNSSKKSVLYIESLGGARVIGRGPRCTYEMEATFRIVGWLNQKQLGTDECDISCNAVADILKAIDFNRRSFGDFSNVKYTFVGQEQKTAAIFNRYTYDEAITQYLLYPYDYFAININASFRVNENCMPGVPENDPIC